jgi:MarR family transcriptional regulator, transcriptional regulator for hemolysin
VLGYDFDESVGWWLTTATQTYHRAFNEELSPYGITFRQAQVLGCLALESELSQAELASRMMIEAPTLVGILDRMQRAGWISRHRCEHDKRRKLIRANPSAEPVWLKIVICAKRIRTRATAGLSEEQVALLKECLAQIRENLSTCDPARTAPHR